jgi:DNA-binding SARP family transcriptional activator
LALKPGATVERVGFRVLGPVEMGDGAARVALGPPRQRAVLGGLLVDCGRPVPVDVLVDRVWGADAPERAARTLHTYIARLRPLIGPERLVRSPGGYLLQVERDQVDLHRFRRLVAEAGDAGTDKATRVGLLREAVALWRGRPLAGIEGEWAERMRRSWGQERVDAVVAWAQAELAAGDPAAVCVPLRGLIEEQPLFEPLVEVLMRALAATGRGAEALQRYAALRERLADELGADPGPELQATYQALLGPARRGPSAPPQPSRSRPAQHSRSRPSQPEPGARHAAAPDRARLARRRGWLAFRALALLGTAVAAALGAWFAVAVAPTGPQAPTLAADPPTPAWIARTSRSAPLFAASGQLLRTVPAGTPISVYCWYPGDPGKPWLGNGIEYHVVYRGASAISGHIPGPYLSFDASAGGEPPAGLRRCQPAPPTPTPSIRR